jgi:hypothetical protein
MMTCRDTFPFQLVAAGGCWLLFLLWQIAACCPDMNSGCFFMALAQARYSCLRKAHQVVALGS